MDKPIINSSLQRLLTLATDAHELMKEHNEVNRRVLDMYEGSGFVRALKYQDIVAQEKGVLVELWKTNKELRALKPHLPSGEALPGRRIEIEFGGYLEDFVASLQHAAEMLLKILEDLGQRCSRKDFSVRRDAQQHCQAMDAYIAAEQKLAELCQQILANTGRNLMA